MTAKEKADELVSKFEESLFGYNVLFHEDYVKCINCALVAVDEILKSNPIMPLSYMLESEALDAGIDYWKEVKQEIENR